MPDLIASIDHLADIPLYEEEKPYVVLVATDRHGYHKTHNLVFETHNGIKITDVRGRDDEFTLDKTGFVVMPHRINVTDLETEDGLRQYQQETATHLKQYFHAEYVHTWEVKVQ